MPHYAGSFYRIPVKNPRRRTADKEHSRCGGLHTSLQAGSGKRNAVEGGEFGGGGLVCPYLLLDPPARSNIRLTWEMDMNRRELQVTAAAVGLARGVAASTDGGRIDRAALVKRHSLELTEANIHSPLQGEMATLLSLWTLPASGLSRKNT